MLREAERLAQHLAPTCLIPGCSVLACSGSFLFNLPRSPWLRLPRKLGAQQQPPFSLLSPWGLLPLPSLPGAWLVTGGPLPGPGSSQ